jgi:hypothetical protein
MFVHVGLVILRDHTNRACGAAAHGVRGTRALSVLAKALYSEDGVEWSRRDHTKTHFCVGKARGLFMGTEPL